MKVLFFGTPDFAVPVLEAIASKHEVCAVVTKLDKPRGRSGHLEPSAVKSTALRLGLPVYQYKSVSKEGISDLSKYNADIIVTCAFGQILKPNILELTPYGVYNVHGSLLPKYRGAAPIQKAIIDGESKTGITILKSGIGIDDGDILYEKELDILPQETAGELFSRLSLLGAECIITSLDMLESGNYSLNPQNHTQATYAKMLDKDMAKIDFNNKTQDIINLVRGLNPSPIAWFCYDNITFQIYKCICATDRYKDICEEYKIGQVIESTPKKGLIIRTCDGAIEVIELKAQNGKQMLAKSYLNGKSIPKGSIINE